MQKNSGNVAQLSGSGNWRPKYGQTGCKRICISILGADWLAPASNPNYPANRQNGDNKPRGRRRCRYMQEIINCLSLSLSVSLSLRLIC